MVAQVCQGGRIRGNAAPGGFQAGNPSGIYQPGFLLSNGSAAYKWEPFTGGVLSSGYLLCGPGDDLRFPFKGVKSLTTTGVFPARPHGTLHPLTPSLTERHTSCLAAPVSTVD